MFKIAFSQICRKKMRPELKKLTKILQDNLTLKA